MESRNPVLVRMEKEAERGGGYVGFGTTGATGTATAGQPAPSAEQLQEMYQAPAAAPPTTSPPMTIADVIAKTGVMFLILLTTATAAWVLAVPVGVVFGAMILGLGLGLWGAASRKVRPGLYLAYAAVQGVMLGGISLWFQSIVDAANTTATTATDSPNIVLQAVIGTLAAFGAMLFLYATRIIKVTGTFQRMMMIAMVAYLGIALVSLVSAFMGVGEGWGFYGVGGLGILLCVAGVALASFSLALDFNAIETAIKAGAPQEMAWRASFGLMVTLIWLYLELLRLLAILNSNN